MEEVNAKSFGRRLAGDESGQGLVFAVLTVFFLALLMLAMFDAGRVSTQRIKIQGAADLAAYSGAAVEANNVSMIAHVNNGMAFIYYHLLRYCVDVITYETLNNLKKHPPLPAFDEYVGTRQIGQKLKDVAALAAVEVPKGEQWLKVLFEINRGIADATPLLVRREAFRAAKANGATKVAMFPDFTGRRDQFDFNFDPDKTDNPFAKHIRHDNWPRFAVEIAVGVYSPPKDELSPPPRPPVENMRMAPWFSPILGRIAAPHHQLRECWFPADQAHGDWTPPTPHPPFVIPDGFTHKIAAYGWPHKQNPNGHFHAVHTHCKIKRIVTEDGVIEVPEFYTHNNGHKLENHPADDDGKAPCPGPATPLHHAIIICPTCNAIELNGDSATDVVVFAPPVPFVNRVVFAPHGAQFPPSLVLSNLAFRYGVNVAVFAPPVDPIHPMLSGPPWGYFAVASAKMGLKQGDEIVVKEPSGFFDSALNLYFTRWDAKLVPTFKALTGQHTAILYGAFGNAFATWRDEFNQKSVDAATAAKYRNDMVHPGFPQLRFFPGDARIEEIVKH